MAGMNWFWKALGGKEGRDQKRSVSLVARAAALEPELKELSDADLVARARDNRDDAPELLACLREVADRAIGMRPFDVQLQGALRLLEGDVVQMATGEGKTLSGALAGAGFALRGERVHSVTVNSYLARRDAEWMGPIFRFLGLTAASVHESDDAEARRAAYASDVVFIAVNELGFDVDELEVKTAADGTHVLVRPRVVDAGYASRKLMRLTGLDVQENQARRLLNDLDTYRASTWRQNDDLEVVATDWMREVYEPTVRMIPPEYRSQIEPAQFFHEVLDHRWFLAENAGHDIPMAEAVQSYVKNVLPQYKLDKKAMKAINADADSGVIDDEFTYGDNPAATAGGHGVTGTDDDGYNPEDDPDAAVWSH